MLVFLSFQEGLEIVDLCFYLKAPLNLAWQGFLPGFSMFSHGIPHLNKRNMLHTEHGHTFLYKDSTAQEKAPCLP